MRFFSVLKVVGLLLLAHILKGRLSMNLLVLLHFMVKRGGIHRVQILQGRVWLLELLVFIRRTLMILNNTLISLLTMHNLAALELRILIQ